MLSKGKCGVEYSIYRNEAYSYTFASAQFSQFIRFPKRISPLVGSLVLRPATARPVLGHIPARGVAGLSGPALRDAVSRVADLVSRHAGVVAPGPRPPGLARQQQGRERRGRAQRVERHVSQPGAARALGRVSEPAPQVGGDCGGTTMHSANETAGQP